MQRPTFGIVGPHLPFTKRLVLLHFDTLIGIVLGNVVVFGKRMGKDKAPTQESDCNSRPMAEPAFARGSPHDQTQHNQYNCDSEPHITAPPFLLRNLEKKDFKLNLDVHLSLGICQRRYLPSLAFLHNEIFYGFTRSELSLTRVFLTTKNEGFYLRKYDLAIEAEKIFRQIACNPKYPRKTIGKCEFLLLGEQEIVQISILKLWAARNKVSFH